MDIDKIKTLETTLREYETFNQKMKEANFSTKEVKAFKKYYNAMHLDLIEYVQFKKDKAFAEKVKELKLSSEIFHKTNKWMALLSLIIIFPGILLIYLYTIKVDNWIMMSVTIPLVIIVFFLIRKIQSQPKSLIEEINKNGKICEKLANLIRKEITNS